MFYSLNRNVFLVKGYNKSCIYDFNTSRLYSINKALADKINDINQGKINTNIKEQQLRYTLNNLVDKDVLILSNNPKPTNIIDILPKQNNNCSFAWIEITEKCNLKCSHCYNESNIHRTSSLTLDEYKLIVDELIKLGVKKIQIIGGEPFLLRDNLKEMLDYSVDKFDLIEIFTNGTLVTNDWMDYLKKAGIKIALSVYSYDSKIHDNVTKCNGSWIKTNHTIDLLKKHGIEYRVCNVLMRDVVIGEKVSDLYTLSHQKDIVRMSGRANFTLLTDDLIKKKLITKSKFTKPINKKFSCSAICGHNCFNSKIYISSKMDVFPCVMERRLKHCNIIENNGIKLKRTIQKMGKDYIDECRYCEYRYACFDCRPDSLSGNILEKPWYCTYNPLLGEWEDVDIFIKHLREKWS